MGDTSAGRLGSDLVPPRLIVSSDDSGAHQDSNAAAWLKTTSNEKVEPGGDIASRTDLRAAEASSRSDEGHLPNLATGWSRRYPLRAARYWLLFRCGILSVSSDRLIIQQERGSNGCRWRFAAP